MEEASQIVEAVLKTRCVCVCACMFFFSSRSLCQADFGAVRVTKTVTVRRPVDAVRASSCALLHACLIVCE